MTVVVFHFGLPATAKAAAAAAGVAIYGPLQGEDAAATSVARI